MTLASPATRYCGAARTTTPMLVHVEDTGNTATTHTDTDVAD